MSDGLQTSYLRRKNPTYRLEKSTHHLGFLKWSYIMIPSIITFLAFIILDPEPNFFLAFFSSVNVIIFIWSFIRLYEMDLLLSPLAAPIIGTASILFYSLGNLGARIEGNSRYLANVGALYYYPQVAFLSTIGLLIFTFISFRLFSKEKFKYHYRDFFWSPYQGIAATVFSIIIIYSLQINFEGIWAIIFNWFSYAYKFILLLGLVINTSIFIKSPKFVYKVVGFVNICVLFLLFLGDRSRIDVFIAAITVLLCTISLKPKKVLPILVSIIFLILILFSLGTVVKVNALGVRGEYVLSNLSNSLNIENNDILYILEENVRLDMGYRMAGYELPATILMNFERDVPPLYGRTFVGAFTQGLPKFIRPLGDYSDREVIYNHFGYKGYLIDDEAMGIPLASGMADFGIVGGLIIYVIMPFLYYFLWILVQRSTRIFIAFLMITTTLYYIDLFWVSYISSFRALAFCWLFMWIFGFMFMPRNNITIKTSSE